MASELKSWRVSLESPTSFYPTAYSLFGSSHIGGSFSSSWKLPRFFPASGFPYSTWTYLPQTLPLATSQSSARSAGVSLLQRGFLRLLGSLSFFSEHPCYFFISFIIICNDISMCRIICPKSSYLNRMCCLHGILTALYNAKHML